MSLLPTPWSPRGEGRRGPLRTLDAAQLLVLSFAGLIALGTAGLLLKPGLYTGPDLGFVDALVTATSAFGTVGLSRAATSDLTPAGRVVVTVLMFPGRLGPLAAVSAMATGGFGPPKYRYATEDVAIG